MTAFWVLILSSTAVYAEQIHVFGDDLHAIDTKVWIIVAATIAAGVLARFTVGNPDADLPKGIRGLAATAILSTVAGLSIFFLCEEYRSFGFPLSDGLELGAIFFGAYNNRKVVDWYHEFLMKRLGLVKDAIFTGKKNGS